MILSADLRSAPPGSASCARKISAMPPTAMRPKMSYLPKRATGAGSEGDELRGESLGASLPPSVPSEEASSERITLPCAGITPELSLYPSLLRSELALTSTRLHFSCDEFAENHAL